MTREELRITRAALVAFTEYLERHPSPEGMGPADQVEAFLSARAPQHSGHPSTCPACRLTDHAPEPQRYWRVIEGGDRRWDAFAVDSSGNPEPGPSLSSLGGRLTREIAVRDGRASGLPEWPGERKGG